MTQGTRSHCRESFKLIKEGRPVFECAEEGHQTLGLSFQNKRGTYQDFGEDEVKQNLDRATVQKQKIQHTIMEEAQTSQELKTPQV